MRTSSGEITTQKEIRAAFWEAFHPRGTRTYQLYSHKRQNECPADIRMEFVEFVDSLQKNGYISEKLAERVTL